MYAPSDDVSGFQHIMGIWDSLKDSVSRCDGKECARFRMNVSPHWPPSHRNMHVFVVLKGRDVLRGPKRFNSEITKLGTIFQTARRSQCIRASKGDKQPRIRQSTSAARNLLLISKGYPQTTPEYSEFLYLCGNHCSQHWAHAGTLRFVPLFHRHTASGPYASMLEPMRILEK